MSVKLRPLSGWPMSSNWLFVGRSRGGLEFWRSRNLKLFAKDSSGRWYQVMPTKKTPEPAP